MNVITKILIGAVGALVILVAAGLYENAKAADNNFVKQAVNPVVQLNRNCSGVVIDTDRETTTYILTANHCVDGDKSGLLSIDEKVRQKVIATSEYVFDVIQRDTTNDLAFLKVRKEGLMLEGAVLATEDPKEGQEVWAVGYPLGWTRTITQGYVGGFESIDNKLTKFDSFGNERPLMRATPPITGGNSGGGLFIKDGDNYKLVGISDAAVPSFGEAALFVPQDKINEIVRGALKSETKTEIPVVTDNSKRRVE